MIFKISHAQGHANAPAQFMKQLSEIFVSNPFRERKASDGIRYDSTTTTTFWHVSASHSCCKERFETSAGLRHSERYATLLHQA
jgi:hypothetical protein